MAMGSTQVICLGSACTGVQLMTTPLTLFASRMTQVVERPSCLSVFTPASQAAAISLEHACGPSDTNNPGLASLNGMPTRRAHSARAREACDLVHEIGRRSNETAAEVSCALYDDHSTFGRPRARMGLR